MFSGYLEFAELPTKQNKEVEKTGHIWLKPPGNDREESSSRFDINFESSKRSKRNPFVVPIDNID